MTKRRRTYQCGWAVMTEEAYRSRVIARLLKHRVITDGDDPCWISTYCTNSDKNGYATTTFHSKNWYVHRLSYELLVGHVPQELFVLHRCDIRVCFRPDHLWLGTALENTADAISKGRLKPMRPTLSDQQIEEVRNEYAAGQTSTHQLAKRYGVCAQTIWNTIHGRNKRKKAS